MVGAMGISNAGCMADPDDGRMPVPGEYLGTYGVNAALLDTSCGAGALSPPGQWDFKVLLSKDGRHLYWTNGAESISGDLASDGKAFSFKTEVSLQLSEPKASRAGCVVWRQDTAEGALEIKKKSSVYPGFSGKLSYSYALGAGSECGDLLDTSGIPTLPCQIRFEMTARREPDKD